VTMARSTPSIHTRSTITFGVPESKNSYFIEANWTQEIAPKLTANAQIARQGYKGTQIHGFHNGGLSYNVYKLGLAYDLGSGWTLGGYVKDTTPRASSIRSKAGTGARDAWSPSFPKSF